MKITNPNDLKAVSTSVEGINYSTEQELVNLPIGSALITGIVDMPLLVNIRPRLSQHGGHAKEILETKEINEENFLEKIEEFENQELLPIIKPKLTHKDIIIMSEKPIEKIENELIPAYLFLCQDKNAEYNLLIEAINGEIVISSEEFLTKKLPEIKYLNPIEIKILHAAYQLKDFTIEDLIKKTNLLDLRDFENLIKKGLIEKTKNQNNNPNNKELEKYSLSNNYIFSNLSKNAIYSKIEFLNLNYKIKHEKKISIDSIKEKLSNFTKIKDQRECYLLKYNINYK
ncbi:MAG: hypothetical protein QW757_04685 [Candidatus Woesearchaeota archaeon]